MCLFAATLSVQGQVTLSGIVKNKSDKTAVPFAGIIVKTEKDSAFAGGTITNEEGRFSLAGIKSGNYTLEVSCMGYVARHIPLYLGNLSNFLDLNTIELEEDQPLLEEVMVVANQSGTSSRLDKKTYSLANNISQSGGSVMQAMQNLPGVTVRDGKIELRGNDKVAILMDGKQTALTGFGDQKGLDNIPASSIERIEIINNPSSKYDANGSAGIINIIYKKTDREGFNGKAGISTGLGALWQRKENLPDVPPQYTMTPKINPSVSVNYRKEKVNIFFQGDYLYTETLNKNEYVSRTYTDGSIVRSQLKRNRNTHFTTLKAGVDWDIAPNDVLTVSGLYGSEKIIDHGDQPFFNEDLTQRRRLWKFIEDELKTTVMATAAYRHKFKEAGHLLNAGFSYTFHREDEKYFFDNILTAVQGYDWFKLISDEQVMDFNVDYIKPLKSGRLETGIKFRKRDIPTNMQFNADKDTSAFDVAAGGKATYRELIPSVYGNFVYENPRWETEIGLRIEYVNLKYEVNPNHPTYKSDGYSYIEPFPTLRLAYKFNERNKISLFYNRRVDRPNEVDIRIFPKYDDAEIVKVGNPALQPQFTNAVELGFKTIWNTGSWYGAVYHKMTNGAITRISTAVPGNDLIYAIFQNAGKSYHTGVEMILAQDISKYYTANLNGNIYHNRINAFTVENKYPIQHTFSANRQNMYSGNVKLNNLFRPGSQSEIQVSAVWLAPDIIPQGKIQARFSLDLGIKKTIQKGKGELMISVTDLLNTMTIRKTIEGDTFRYTLDDYYETQVMRIGYSYKF
ncbi:TonB-dependent receptor [Bacteroidia bacterium]|nr:TonB-dependent receptor [Bacteroidia bacterium]